MLVYCLSFSLLTPLFPVWQMRKKAQEQSSVEPAYKQASAPLEQRVRDLLSRMTLEEKVRQLDLYSGARALVDKHTDDTHAASDAVFLPDRAESLWGNLGVGGIHDLNPTPDQANAIQKWVMAHSRLGIPALFAEEGLHGFRQGTIFPAPINLAATWNRNGAADRRRHCGRGPRDGRGHASCSGARSGARAALGPRRRGLRRGPVPDRADGAGLRRGLPGRSLHTDHTVSPSPSTLRATARRSRRHQHLAGALWGARAAHGDAESFEPAFREGHAMGTMAAYHEIDGIPVTADPFLLKTDSARRVGLQGVCALGPGRD